MLGQKSKKRPKKHEYFLTNRLTPLADWAKFLHLGDLKATSEHSHNLCYEDPADKISSSHQILLFLLPDPWDLHGLLCFLVAENSVMTSACHAIINFLSLSLSAYLLTPTAVLLPQGQGLLQARPRSCFPHFPGVVRHKGPECIICTEPMTSVQCCAPKCQIT